MPETIDIDIGAQSGSHDAQAAMARRITVEDQGHVAVNGDDTASSDKVASASVALARVVGQNLKRLRRRQGYSLERLAKLSSVSRAMLGQIETGRSVPTVGLLAKIAVALDVSLASLLTPQDAVETEVLRVSQTRSIVSGEGRFVARALFPFGSEERVEVYEVTIAAGHAEADRPHPPGTRENIVVLEGIVDVQVGRERPVRLTAGDAVVFAADQPHVYRNAGSGLARLHLVTSRSSGG